MSTIGAVYSDQSTTFTVWAPKAGSIDLILDNSTDSIKMVNDNRGYWSVTVKNVSPGTRYQFLIDNKDLRPDPCSNYQASSVHGPSVVINHGAYTWSDSSYSNRPLNEYIIYELHVGTFTPEGTFEGVEKKIPYLQELGITAIEIMPVSQFPGGHNWGYDGVFPFAVQNSYGGPDSLKRLIDKCHRASLAVILDVVYNHLGPEGNYLNQYGYYFTDKYHTPWGWAINYDGEHSNHVREYFISNALYWFDKFHIDALRLDAIHGIMDFGAHHFLEELSERVTAFAANKNRSCHLIAESDLNDIRVITSRDQGGFGLDGQWSDDFHHAIHTLLTKEKNGYYEDFGSINKFDEAFKNGFCYRWNYSKHRKRFHGSKHAPAPDARLVVFSQNHDQIGNRMFGERLGTLVPFEALKLASAAVLTAPAIPLLFMGEEYGETAPFLYFINHGDPKLVTAVRQGRKGEFSAFSWKGEPPDPQDDSTFLESKLQWHRLSADNHSVLHSWYKRLLALRREYPPLHIINRAQCTTWVDKEKDLFFARRITKTQSVEILMNWSANTVSTIVPAGFEGDTLLIDSADQLWNGPPLTSAPAQISSGQTIVLQPYHIAIYI